MNGLELLSLLGHFGLERILSNHRVAILAPHPDDELIGLGMYFVLMDMGSVRPKDITVYYVRECEGVRRREAERLCEDYGLKMKLGLIEDPSTYDYCLVPSPFERHPDHNRVTRFGLENFDLDRLVFYSVNMAEPWVERLLPEYASSKRKLLDKYYPSQRSLWAENPRYYMFEGWWRGLPTEISVSMRHDEGFEATARLRGCLRPQDYHLDEVGVLLSHALEGLGKDSDMSLSEIVKHIYHHIRERINEPYISVEVELSDADGRRIKVRDFWW